MQRDMEDKELRTNEASVGNEELKVRETLSRGDTGRNGKHKPASNSDKSTQKSLHLRLEARVRRREGS